MYKMSLLVKIIFLVTSLSAINCGIREFLRVDIFDYFLKLYPSGLVRKIVYFLLAMIGLIGFFLLFWQ